MRFDFKEKPAMKQEPRDGFGFIYKYTFLNGKSYIGQTVHSVANRHYGHRCGNLLVDRIIRECEDHEKPYDIEILGEYPVCGEKNIDDMEVHYISEFNTRYPHGYNMTDGGTALPIMSEESRRKRIEKMSGEFNWRFGENVIYCPQTNRVYDTLTQASLELNVSIPLICQIVKGDKDSVHGYTFEYVDDLKDHESRFTRMARAVSKYYNKIETDMKYHDERAELCRELSKTNIGRKKTEEQRRKISEANKGRKLSEEAKQKISESKKGRPGVRHSEETKEKLSKMMMGERNPQFGKRGKDAIASKEVIAFEYPSMKELKRFDSQAEASEYYNIPFQSVSYSCTKRTIYKDLMIGFKFADDVDYKVKQTITVVGKFDMQDNLLDTFNSYAEAAESIGVTLSAIRSCCTGRTKQCQGFKWKRLN